MLWIPIAERTVTSRVIYMAIRYICLDVETNGFRSAEGAPRSEWTLPSANCPIQLSVDIVEDGVVWHAMDTCIQGATQLAP